jgi:hypothetical protein
MEKRGKIYFEGSAEGAEKWREDRTRIAREFNHLFRSSGCFFFFGSTGPKKKGK